MPDMLATITTLCDTLLGLQVTDAGSGGYGGFWCPGDSRVHGRSGDAILPLMYLYSRGLGDGYMKGALMLLDFIENHQQPDGSWFNETDSGWKGISLFQMLSLLDAYRLDQKEGLLDGPTRERLLSIIRKGGAYALSDDYMGANINYPITAVPVLHMLHMITGDDAYAKALPRRLDMALGSINGDGFIVGEGKVFPPRTKHDPVDIGYNVDMSLGALAMYYRLSGDERVKEPLIRAMRAHMAFFYPDGSLDGSWSCRLYKWSLFGSKTAHGSQMAYMLMQDEDPAFARVAELNHRYLAGLVRNGFVELGPHFVDTGEEPCIHSTFNRADSLSRALMYSGGLGRTAPIPAETPAWMRVFGSVQVALVRTRGFMGTVSGYGYRGEGTPLVPTGGTVSYLWHGEAGPVQISSETLYHRHEVGNMPPWNGEGCLTPAIVLTRDGVGFSNLFCFDSEMGTREEGGAFVVETKGQLLALDGKESGVRYTLTHTFTDDSVTKSFNVTGLDDGDALELKEPLVCRRRESVSVEGRTVRVAAGASGEGVPGIGLAAGEGIDSLRVGDVIQRPFPAVSGVDVRFIPRVTGGRADARLVLGVGDSR